MICRFPHNEVMSDTETGDPTYETLPPHQKSHQRELHARLRRRRDTAIAAVTGIVLTVSGTLFAAYADTDSDDSLDTGEEPIDLTADFAEFDPQEVGGEWHAVEVADASLWMPLVSGRNWRSQPSNGSDILTYSGKGGTNMIDASTTSGSIFCEDDAIKQPYDPMDFEQWWDHTALSIDATLDYLDGTILSEPEANAYTIDGFDAVTYEYTVEWQKSTDREKLREGPEAALIDFEHFSYYGELYIDLGSDDIVTCSYTVVTPEQDPPVFEFLQSTLRHIRVTTDG